jgi:hypothetical protein
VGLRQKTLKNNFNEVKNFIVRSINVRKFYSSIHKIMAKVIEKGTSSQTCENHKTIH